MQITQADIDWTVEFWRDVWTMQGKQYATGRIIDRKADTSIAIESFIDGFVMLQGFGTTWREEMGKFKDAILDEAAKKIVDKQAVALKDFASTLNKVAWETALLKDNQDNVHELVVASDIQVVTESVGSYFVWDKATGACLIQGCEAFEMMVSG